MSAGGAVCFNVFHGRFFYLPLFNPSNQNPELVTLDFDLMVLKMKDIHKDIAIFFEYNFFIFLLTIL